MHGLLGELDIELLPGMSGREMIPYMLRYDEAERVAPRTAASLIEIDRSLSTWPQLASDVNVGASAMAEAVRRIGLGENLRSGRCRIDIGWALNQLDAVEMAQQRLSRKSSMDAIRPLPQSTTPLSLPLCAPPRGEIASHGISTRKRPNSP